MKKTYTQLVKQIEALKVEAEKARRHEAEGVVARIREAIKFYNLTAADLGLGSKTAKAATAVAMPGRRKTSAKTKAAATPAAIKYRDEQGRGWVGRGKRPQWLRDALATGKSLQDYLVK